MRNAGSSETRQHQPMMSPERVERLRAWQDRGYRPDRDSSRSTRVSYLDRVFDVPETVHPPKPVSHVLGSCVLDEVQSTDRVLDMGTGSGVNAILAASRASDVVAVDINPDAVRCAFHNAALNGVADRVKVFESDVFERVEGTFDLIIFDPPFRWFAPRDMYERSTADEGYRALTEFFAEVNDYLAEDGRILNFFGTSGDIDYLKHLICAAGFARRELRTLSGLKGDEVIKYYTFKLTPR